MRDKDHAVRVTATIFRMAAFVVLVVGIAGALVAATELARNATVGTETVVWTGFGIAAVTVVAAGALAFFGHALDLLSDIRAAVEGTEDAVSGEPSAAEG